jgi:ribose 5-phosphate isomerase B
MKISIGNDHAGPDYKKAIVDFLEEKGHTIFNHGTDTFDSVDYPDFGHAVAYDVESKKADFGIVICGSGNGIAMTVNKHQDIRAALCWTKEIATLARQHNDANVVAVGARQHSQEEVLELIKAFISEPFSLDERHIRRIGKIATYEQTSEIL